VLVPEIRHDFFSSAIDGVEEVAFSMGYTVHIAKSNEDYQREVMNTRSFNSNRVAGVIASVSQNTMDGHHFQKLINVGIPVVLFDRVLDDLEVNKVIVDDYEAAKRAVNHFIESGYRRIALLTGPPHLNITRERQRGYVDALSGAGMEIDEDLILTCELTEEEGERGMRELLAGPKLPDAVFAINDPLAVGAHRQIRSSGLRMPEDIGLMGFSNNPVTYMIDPPLTTTDQHGYELGRKAARILLAEISGEHVNARPETYIVPSTFIIRRSSQRREG
jgi:DNA-binding LacI/PurR family transcriptional regulator